MSNSSFFEFLQVIKGVLARFPVLVKIPIWYLAIIMLVGYTHSLTQNLQIAYLISMLLIGGLFWRDIRQSGTNNLGNPRMWLTMIGAACAYAIALALTGAPFVPANLPVVLSDLGTIAINATWEEVVFRGVLFAQFIRVGRGHSVIEILLLSNFLFTATHIVSFQQSNQADTYVVLVFLLGIVFSQVYMLSRNLLFAALLHTLANAINGMFVTEVGVLGSFGSTVLLSGVGGLVLVLFWLQRRQA